MNVWNELKDSDVDYEAAANKKKEKQSQAKQFDEQHIQRYWNQCLTDWCKDEKWNWAHTAWKLIFMKMPWSHIKTFNKRLNLFSHIKVNYILLHNLINVFW